MQLFINEWSLEAQYSDLTIFRNALLTILGLAKAIHADFETCRNYYAEDYLYAYEYTAFSDEPFMTFHQINDVSFKTYVRRILYEELRVSDWRSEQVHNSEALYECLADLCSGTSVAEAAERLMQNGRGPTILLNFTPSKFDGLSVVAVTKDSIHTVHVDCSNTLAMVAAWLQKIKRLVPVYDLTSRETPRDEQTVLTDIMRFKLTPYRKQGRKVYEERATRYKMYVDNLHYGEAAHIEVFSKSNQHLGTAGLDGTIDLNKVEAGREFTPDF